MILECKCCWVTLMGVILCQWSMWLACVLRQNICRLLKPFWSCNHWSMPHWWFSNCCLFSRVRSTYMFEFEFIYGRVFIGMIGLKRGRYLFLICFQQLDWSWLSLSLPPQTFDFDLWSIDNIVCHVILFSVFLAFVAILCLWFQIIWIIVKWLVKFCALF